MENNLDLGSLGCLGWLGGVGGGTQLFWEALSRGPSPGLAQLYTSILYFFTEKATLTP